MMVRATRFAGHRGERRGRNCRRVIEPSQAAMDVVSIEMEVVGEDLCNFVHISICNVFRECSRATTFPASAGLRDRELLDDATGLFQQADVAFTPDQTPGKAEGHHIRERCAQEVKGHLPLGTHTRNVDPFPTSLSTATVPPSSSISRFTICSPSPVPCCEPQPFPSTC
jgi:hypothetical protein